MVKNKAVTLVTENFHKIGVTKHLLVITISMTDESTVGLTSF